MKKETIFKFYQKYRLYIFPVIVALSSLFLIVFAILPQTSKLISNQKDQADLLDKSKFLENKVLALESHDEADLSRQVEAALFAFPGDKDFGEAIGLLQQLISQSGFTIVSFALGGNSKSSFNSQSYEIKLEMTGVKPALPILLNSLEDSPRLIRVTNISVTSGLNPQSVNVSMVVEVLYAPVPQNFGSVDSPVPDLSQKDEELLAKLTTASSGIVQSRGASSPESSSGLSSGLSSSSSLPSGPRGKANPFE